MLASLPAELQNAITCVKRALVLWYFTAGSKILTSAYERMNIYGFTLREGAIQVALHVSEQKVVWMDSFGNVRDSDADEINFCRSSWMASVRNRPIRTSQVAIMKGWK